MTGLLLTAILAPVGASVTTLLAGWRRATATLIVLSAVAVLGCGAALGFRVGSGTRLGLGGLLRVDALTVTMLIVIGIVAALATWASIGYIDSELAHGHTDLHGARIYGALTAAFLAAMVVAVCANNIGVIWIAIEATTVITAFLVGHRRTRGALEATWKYVVICSVGIAIAFLGTVLLYYAAEHAGAPAAAALNLDVLAAHAGGLNPDIARLAGGLLLIGYGAKVGLFPFHTWLADAHSQAPAPVSALMSGVLLSVAFSVLIRLKPIIDAAVGPTFMRSWLLVIGLATLVVAALMLTVTPADISAVLRRSRLVGVSLAVGVIVLLGLPPFAMFASELAIARSLADARLTWAIGAGLLMVAIAFAALARNFGRILLGDRPIDTPEIAVPRTVAAALLIGVAASLVLGVTAGPLTGLFTTAASDVGAAR